MKKYHLLERENGLIELVCEHGVGHPSKLLTPPKYYYGVHGCDGCCDHPDFVKREKQLIGELDT